MDPQIIKDRETRLIIQELERRIRKLENEAKGTAAQSDVITDHGRLSGLADDDHSQYLNNTRGDLRYTPVAHVGSSGAAHAVATGAAAGFMAAADKTKLDGIAAGAQPGTVTSVALSVPTGFTVSGSPVTGDGTLSFSWSTTPTSSNTANAIVQRNGSGGFSMGALSATSGIFSGNLAAGVASAGFRADFQQDGATCTVGSTAFGSGVNGGFIGRSARGTQALPTFSSTGDTLASLGARGYGATGFASGSRAAILMVAAEAWDDAKQGTYMTLGTTKKGTTSRADRVLIDDAGKVSLTPDASVAALNVPVLTAAPATLANGDVWITDSAGVRKLNARIGGVTYSATLT